MVLAASATAAAEQSLASPDAKLIPLCADLNATERQIAVLFDFEPSGPTDPRLEGADAAAYLIDLDQRLIVDRICDLAPATLAGCIALAGSLTLISPGLVDAPAEAAMEERLTSTLLRGLRREA